MATDMRPARSIAWACLVVIACSVALSVRSWIEARTAAVQSRQVSVGIEAVARRTSQLKARLAAAENACADLKKGASVAGAPKKPARSPDWFELLHNDPVVQARFLDYQKSGFSMLYGPLFRKLHLTPEQVSQFEAALARKEEESMDLNASLMDQHLTWSDPAAQKLYTQIYAECHSALSQVLGDSGLKAYEAYDQGLPARSAVTGFAGAAAASGMPVTPDQLAQLTTVATQAKVGAAGPDWDTIMAQATTILSPAQLDLLKTGEFRGPGGNGSQFLFKLNNAITSADNADGLAGGSVGAAGSASGAR